MQNQQHIIRVKLRDINERDQVYLKCNHKFNQQFIGPFTVIKKRNIINFEILRPNNSKALITKVHIDHLWLAPRRSRYLKSIMPVDHHFAEPSEPIIVPEADKNIDNTDSPLSQL